MDQDELKHQIEGLFANASVESLRETTRALEKLVRQVTDTWERKRYEDVIDMLPDMVKHTNEGG